MPDPTLGAATAAAATTAVGKVVGAAVQGIGTTINARIGKVARSVLDRAIVALQIGFEDYLATSYNKCRHFKSILTPHAPIELLSHYVHVKLTCGSEKIDDFDLVERITEKRHVVITGLAGSGKSMLMKYLTVMHFEYPKGAIPLFVELRHLNAVTDPDLLTFIRSSCTSKDHNVTAEQFGLSLRAGAMMLVLDGFDELHNEIRENIQRQILVLQKDYPETTIVVSSRPDERFSSWSSYYIYKVDALEKNQVITLIKSLEYDSAVKRRFQKEVTSKLYESHTSFLSSPLLASIMLLTYEEFAEIPQKMHAFYGQAFDTLIQRHDAQKEQYQRKTHTQLTRDAFKDCFSAFCAMSYLEQRFSFDDEALNATATSAVRYMKQTSEGFPRAITEDQFVADLFESVCMLQKDGLEAVFVHRSFQEYFTALFVKGLHGERIKKFLDRCALRWDDSVIPMAVDMSRQVIENEWVLPTIEQLERDLGLANPRVNLAPKMKAVIPGLYIQNFDAHFGVSAKKIEWDVFGEIESIGRVYPRYKLHRSPIFRRFSQITPSEFYNTINVDNYKDKPRFAEVISYFSPRPEGGSGKKQQRLRSTRSGGLILKLSSNNDDDWWLSEIGIDQAFEDLAKGFAAIKRDIRGRDKRRENILDEFL